MFFCAFIVFFSFIFYIHYLSTIIDLFILGGQTQTNANKTLYEIFPGYAQEAKVYPVNFIAYYYYSLLIWSFRNFLPWSINLIFKFCSYANFNIFIIVSCLLCEEEWKSVEQDRIHVCEGGRQL